MRLTTPEDFVELTEMSSMDRSTNVLQSEQVYEPLLNSEQQAESHQDSHDEDYESTRAELELPFSRWAYCVFLLLGLAMLWPWNMFLAAAPYFQKRFVDDTWILNHFQPAETSVATVTNLIWVIVLSKLQENALYTRRITISLISYILLFTILAISTLFQTEARPYFGFLLVVILASSSATGLVQNGVFAFTIGFGRKEYTQAIMTGQAIAGVLPSLVQIISVAAGSTKHEEADAPAVSSRSAFAYFLTAAIISGVTIVAFFNLLRRRPLKDASQHNQNGLTESFHSILSKDDAGSRKSVPLSRLFWKMPWVATAVVVCFAVTMVFPVFTATIQSTNGINPALFVPLAFLVWNLGDLTGRLLTLIPQILLTSQPFASFCFAMARLLFIPLYFLCNIKGRGAAIDSDFFYLVVVQFLFGLTNGYLGSSCIMSAGDWVAPDEREAVGGFMALCVMLGLTIGSLLSFTLGDI